LDAVLSYVA